MNQVIQVTVRELSPVYQGKSDADIVNEIRMGHHAGEALFYLLFGRYAEMLHIIFQQQPHGQVEFDDFMLELDIKLFAMGCAIVRSFDIAKASFNTYLSRIARNLLYDMNAKEMPMLDIETIQEHVYEGDAYEMFALMDAINTYPNPDSRYVLFKTIEGYTSKEIAAMLSSRRREQGTLEDGKELKPSYIDTLRSRALKAIRKRIACTVDDMTCTALSMESADYEIDSNISSYEQARIAPSRQEMSLTRISRSVSLKKVLSAPCISMAFPDAAESTNLFLLNISQLYSQMMEE